MFSDLTEDELSEWIRHPVTEVFIATLKEHEARAVADVVAAACRDGADSINGARRLAGKVEGIRLCITTAEATHT